MPDEKKCACGCGGTLPADSVRSYKRGHKPKAGTPGKEPSKPLPSESEFPLLLVPANDELCDKVWERLNLAQKVTALNAIYQAKK